MLKRNPENRLHHSRKGIITESYSYPSVLIGGVQIGQSAPNKDTKMHTREVLF